MLGGSCLLCKLSITCIKDQCLQSNRWPGALQRHNTENSKQIFPEKELRGLDPNFHIHMSVSDLYFPTLSLLGKYVVRSGNITITHRHINVEIGTEAAQFLF